MLLLALILIVVLLSLLFSAVWVRRGHSERARRLLARGTMPSSQWFERFLPGSTADERRALSALLVKLGQDLEVDWTCLRPEDRVTQELRVAPRFLERDIFLTFEDDLARWFDTQGIAWSPPLKFPDQFGAFIAVILGLLRQHRATGAAGHDDSESGD